MCFSVTTLLKEDSVLKEVNLNQTKQASTIHDCRMRILERKPQYAANFDRVLKRLVPEIQRRNGEEIPVVVGDNEIWEACQRLPSIHLAESLEGRVWANWLVEANPEFKSVPALARDYRKAFVICMKHLSQSHFIPTWTIGLSEAWQEPREELRRVLPYTQRAVEDMIAAGVTECFGHSLVKRSPKHLSLFFRWVIDSVAAFGRFCMKHGIDDPKDVRGEHIFGPGATWYNHHKAKAYSPTTVYHHTKAGWNILKQLHSEWSLTDWPDPRKNRNYRLAEEERPHLLVRMVEDIKAIAGLEESTNEDMAQHIFRLTGYLKNHLGFDIERLCTQLRSPKELAALLTAGYSPVRRGYPPDPQDELRMVFTDPAYRNNLLLEIPAANAQHEFHGPVRANPAIESYVSWQIERGHTSAAENVVKHIRIIGQKYLRSDLSQFGWCKRLWQTIRDAKQKEAPSKRGLRTRNLSKYPELWLKFVEARPRLRTNSQMLRKRYDDAMRPKSKRYWGMRWAVAVRDELIVGMLLGFFFRASNIARMEIGKDVDTERYLISLWPDATKADNAILRRFHEKGPLSDLMGIFDEYYHEARPILLDGRSDQGRLFVSAHRSNNATDDAGNLVFWRDQVSKALHDLCHRHYKDLMPSDVGTLTPADIRNLWGHYTAELPDGTALGAQGLANSQTTATQFYMRSERAHGRKAQRHIESLDIGSAKKRLGGKAADRRNHRKFLAETLGEDIDPRKINAILNHFHAPNDF